MFEATGRVDRDQPSRVTDRGTFASAKAVVPWSKVQIDAVVIEQNRGQTLMFGRGVGRSGLWSIVNSIEVLVTLDQPDPMVIDAIRAALEREKQQGIVPEMAEVR